MQRPEKETSQSSWYSPQREVIRFPMVWCSNRAVMVGRGTSMTHRNQTAIPPQIGCWENRVAPHGADGADGSRTKAPVLRWLRAVLPLRILLDTGVKSRRFGYQTERDKGTHLIGQGASWAHNAYKRRWGYNARPRIRKPGPSTPSVSTHSSGSSASSSTR